MTVPSEARGIHQSDLIIRTALMAALDDMRANPWLLDYALASLPQDTLTANEYGQREIEAAKKWFLSTKVPVFMSTVVNEPTFPCISITLADSVEAETTLGDTHYVPEQDDSRLWPALTPTFTPVYIAATGVMMFPRAVGLVLAPGQQVLDRAGKPHDIIEVLDDRVARIKPGTVADFEGAVIKGRRPTGRIAFESVRMKETYALGSHVQGEQVHLTYLHSLLVFALYRYKADFMEARGFERSVVSSSDFRRNDAFENELTFSRHVNLTGYVSQVWPGKAHQKITATMTQLQVCGAGRLPPEVDPTEAAWLGEEDALVLALKMRR